MRKLIFTALVMGTSLYAEVHAPKVLVDNSFETAEYQLFVTNTRHVAITQAMTTKLVYEGDIKGYYKKHHKMVEKQYKTAEEVTKRLSSMSGSLGNALYYKDVQSLQNIGVATIGSMALNAMLGGILGDETYVQVKDYYLDGKIQTRLIKYLSSDDGLDEKERKMVYSTTNNQSYHYRSGGFQSVTFK